MKLQPYQHKIPIIVRDNFAAVLRMVEKITSGKPSQHNSRHNTVAEREKKKPKKGKQRQHNPKLILKLILSLIIDLFNTTIMESDHNNI